MKNFLLNTVQLIRKKSGPVFNGKTSLDRFYTKEKYFITVYVSNGLD
jgi:hypothetical protein